MSNPRPIPTSRDLRETPNAAEPSNSFEDTGFLTGSVDMVEDEFHRRMASSNRASGGASFWRTANNTTATAAASGATTTLPSRPVTVNERRSSGGLLGAALQLRTQSSTVSDTGGANTSQKQPSKPLTTSTSTGSAPLPTETTNGDPKSAASKQRATSADGASGANSNAGSSSQGLFRRSSSNMSQTSAKGEAKKSAQKQRQAERRLKLESQLEEVDIGHVVDVPTTVSMESPAGYPSSHYYDTYSHYTGGGGSKDGGESVDSTHSDGSGNEPARGVPRTGSGGLFHPKTASRPPGGVLKGGSLIFPTGVETTSAPSTSAGTGTSESESGNAKKQRINLLLDQCEAIRFPFKKKLMLNSLNLTAADIPVKDLNGTSLGKSLYKLSLAGNRLSTIPPKLVTCLPGLKTLDLSQCELHQLPERWSLPQLKRLNLSHNRLTDFPEETMLEGILDLQELNMYGNKVSVIVIPHNPKLLAKLDNLNLGYNDLAYIPDDLDRLRSLRTLKVMNNFLEKIPMRVCDMELKTIDVSSNPVIQPPIETCERGICSMKRYYHCLRMEEQSKQKAREAFQVKQARLSKKNAKNKKKFNLAKPNRIMQISLGRKTSDDSNSQTGTHGDSTNSATDVGNLKAPDSTKVPARSVSLTASTTLGMPTSPVEHGKSAPRVASMPSSTAAEEVRRTQSLGNRATLERLEEAVQAPARPTVVEIPPTAGEEMKEFNAIDDVTVNDTLKVIFVGMAMAGKTSMIKRLIEGESAVIPKRDERTVGVDIYGWDPIIDKRFEHIDSRIQLQDKELEVLCGDVDVKFSVWDFAGQHVYHATHELFFSPRALYVLVWDMGATNPATKLRKSEAEEEEKGAFSLNYDSDDDSSRDDDFTMEEEKNRADRALKRDIDDKIQFWVDCIQSSAPGAAILPVASFDDLFASNPAEALRRCDILKKRLLEHEFRRVKGIEQRLQEYVNENRANDEGALRLRKLRDRYSRPKLIFGDTYENAVVRVSGTRYTGFADLTERIINIATGRERANMKYPIFRGHVGARIPRMRVEVREAVRRMRDRFKVVEWGYFIKQLRGSGLTNVEDISDALHFLTNIGELSYFGGVLADRTSQADDSDDGWRKESKKSSATSVSDDVSALSDDEMDEDDQEDTHLSMDNTTITMPTTDAGSIATLGESLQAGLSQFVFLNPRWLVAAVACILRHDLDREIQETRRALSVGHKQISRDDSFYEANLNCPVITADDACMLWQGKKFTKKAVERVEEYSNDMPVKPFEFLQLLLIRFGVFVPIDLDIEKALLGGKEYAHRLPDEDATPEEITIGQSNTILKATFFFLPSLLGPGEPAEAWTYKSTDSWKATLCHSVLFPDGVPPGLMERITASVLSNVYAIAHVKSDQPYKGFDGANMATYEGQLTVKEVLCWRTAFLLKVGMQGATDMKESIVEVFCGLVDKESHLCVGSDHMLSGMRRLITSGKGQEGDGGRKIWKGGYLIVLKAVQKVMEEYGGLEYEKQGFCPACLAKKAVAEASYWDFTVIRSAAKDGESIVRCRHGHRVDTRLVAGPSENLQARPNDGVSQNAEGPIVPINDLLRSVVVVGLWDGKTNKVVRVGSGFIADKRRGLIVTASHTLMNIWGDKSTPFGENYYGLRQGKVVIGVIPRKKGEEAGTEAVFRYFAKIVAKDPSIEQQVCHLDACVLKITTRMESDVGGNGEGCGSQPERLLLNNPHALKQEKMHQLKITDKCELDEQVRIVGFNQGGEGLLGPGVTLNRYVDFARGYVCKKFAAGEGNDEQLRHRFKPREEIVVMCPTIGGHSGGPCVNQQGEVIGILSRADPAESQRCYLVPTYEWRPLLREAKNSL